MCIFSSQTTMMMVSLLAFYENISTKNQFTEEEEEEGEKIFFMYKKKYKTDRMRRYFAVYYTLINESKCINGISVKERITIQNQNEIREFVFQ